MSETYESINDELDAMINGTYDYGEEEQHQEDGNIDPEDNSGQDPEENGTEEQDENSNVDSGSIEDEGIANTDTDTLASEGQEAQSTDDNNGSEDNGNGSDTDGEANLDDAGKTELDNKDEPKDENNPDTDATDYKSEYERLQAETEKYKAYYDAIVNTEFKANGKMMRGPDNPKEVIQRLQMASDYVRKNEQYKKFKPFHKALEEQGLVDDPSKFNLALSVINKDKGAIAKIVKEAGIDPYDLENIDGENNEADSANYIQSQGELALSEMADMAYQNGVGDKFIGELTSTWDNDSVHELVQNRAASAELIQHMDNGMYDAIQARIEEKSMSDRYGAFGSKSRLQQYNEAWSELDAEYKQSIAGQNQNQQPPRQETVPQQVQAEPNIEQQVNNSGSELNEIEAARKQLEADRAAIEAEKAAIQKQKADADADAARRAATNISTTQKEAGTQAQTIGREDKADLEGDAFLDYFESLLK
jgi:hypothetical protein